MCRVDTVASVSLPTLYVRLSTYTLQTEATVSRICVLTPLEQRVS